MRLGIFDLRPLRSRTFGHLLVAGWINEAGNSLGEVALAWLVYDRTGSPLASSLLFLALRFLPALLGPMLTAYVEAMNPRVVVTICYLLEACLFAAIASVAHHFSLPLVLAMVAADGTLAILASALARTAAANELTALGLLREGNSLVNLGTMVAFAAAPIVAGAIIATHGASTALRLDAASFVLAALVIVTARGIHVVSDHAAGASGRIKAGIAVLRRQVAVRRLLVAIALTTMTVAVTVPIEVVFAKTTLDAGSRGYGLLLTSWGAGMIIGGAVFAVATDLRLLRLLGVSTLMMAIGHGGLALSPTLAIACAASIVGGIGNGIAWVAAMTEFQQRIPVRSQSAVMSVFFALSYLMPGVGFAIGGAITELTSPRVAYAVSGVGTALVVAIFAIRPIDRVRLSPVPKQPIKQDEWEAAPPTSHRPDLQETVPIRRSHDSPSVNTG